MANALASKGETIWPDELLGSGTVGTGSGAEHGKQLHQGDVVELEVQGIGVLRNRIGQPEPRKSRISPSCAGSSECFFRRSLLSSVLGMRRCNVSAHCCHPERPAGQHADCRGTDEVHRLRSVVPSPVR